MSQLKKISLIVMVKKIKNYHRKMAIALHVAEPVRGEMAQAQQVPRDQVAHQCPRTRLGSGSLSQ